MEAVSQIELRPLHDLGRAEQMQILAIRNQPDVRRNMYTSHEIGLDEHLAWVERLADDKRTKFFAVYRDGQVIGGVSLNDINEANRRADWAFYLDAAVQGKGLGAALEFQFLDYAFGEAGLRKLNCEVLAFNAAVIRLHKKFGFVEEGVRRAHIERDDEQIDTVLLGITADEWQERRGEMARLLFR